MHQHSPASHSRGHHHGHGGTNRKALLTALSITTGIMVLEFIGGLITNSLALLSDAGHMLSDVGSLALSLAALQLAARPFSPTKTYGFYLFEILAAFVNGVTLFIIAGLIIWEAYERFAAPPAVNSVSMMAIAAIGLLANLASAWALKSGGDVDGAALTCMCRETRWAL